MAVWYVCGGCVQDIRFPDVSQHGQGNTKPHYVTLPFQTRIHLQSTQLTCPVLWLVGLHLASYPDVSLPWRKLTLWQSLAKDTSPLRVPVRHTHIYTNTHTHPTTCLFFKADCTPIIHILSPSPLACSAVLLSPSAPFPSCREGARVFGGGPVIDGLFADLHRAQAQGPPEARCHARRHVPLRLVVLLRKSTGTSHHTAHTQCKNYRDLDTHIHKARISPPLKHRDIQIRTPGALESPPPPCLQGPASHLSSLFYVCLCVLCS
jgi:hypothetical protein